MGSRSELRSASEGGRGGPAAGAVPWRRGGRARRPGAADRSCGGALTQGLEGLPIVKPPYGVLSAIDVNNGDLLFQVPHGDTPDVIKNHPLLKGMNIAEDRAGRQRGRADHQDARDRGRSAADDAR